MWIHCMSPIIILVISIVLVVAGILVCKLHAFLALLLAALVAAFLTSESALDTYADDEGATAYAKLFGDEPGDPIAQQEYLKNRAAYLDMYKTQCKKKSAMVRVA